MEVTKANLATYLAGLTPSATPYPIEITETVASDWRTSVITGTVGHIIRTITPIGVYIDLGLTSIPNSVISMNGTFYGCTSLTTAPSIPSSVTSMASTLEGCTSLTTAPSIPSSVTSMQATFYGCSLLHTIVSFAVDVDNCYMTNAFLNCPALANIYVTALTESSWHLLHTDTDATGTDYTIYNPDGTVAGSGTVAGTSQVLTLYGKSDELVISANITPTLAVETATSQVQWHKSGLPYDDELMIFNAKNPDTVISNFITVNRAGEEFLGNSATATTAQTATTASTADKWKTARNIAISDADGTNTGTAVAVDGSENETLKLPATIKATLSGKATTATKLATARKINGVDFDGSANITVADSTKAPTSHASSAVTYGVSSEANYGHAKASAVAGSANGTASKGSTPTVFAQSNHVHPYEIESLRKSANFTLGTYADGKKLRIANTHTTNTITCTLPTGQTMNGQSSFTVIAGKILELELIGSVWIDTNTDYYSTTEQVIGTWIDGKPLYRKVVNFGALPNSATKLVAHGITNIDTLVRLSGVARMGSIADYLTLPHVNPNTNSYSVSTSIVGNDVEIITGTNRSKYNASKVIIEYTKTTD